MTIQNIAYLAETPGHDAAIEAINEEAFGPGRFARAAYRIREGGPHERALSKVALAGDEVVASVRLTRIVAGAGQGLLLGPLAVRPVWKNLGIGKHLVKLSLEDARHAGYPAVILVGDEPYYGPLGFARIPRGQIAMPRPVDPERLLIAELTRGALAQFSGEMRYGGVGQPGP